jgi:hypothetical protein
MRRSIGVLCIPGHVPAAEFRARRDPSRGQGLLRASFTGNRSQDGLDS